MNAFEEKIAYQLIYAGCEPEPGRFTTDLPINAEVWLAYRKVDFARPRELLLTPHLAAGVGELRKAVTSRLPSLRHDGKVFDEEKDQSSVAFVATNESHLLANISFTQLLELLPMTAWWHRYVRGALTPPVDEESIYAETRKMVVEGLRNKDFISWLSHAIAEHIESEQALLQFRQIGLDASEQPFFSKCDKRQKEAVRRLVNVAALYVALTLLDQQKALSVSLDDSMPQINSRSQEALEILARCIDKDAVADASTTNAAPVAAPSPLWSVAVNRGATHAVYASRKTVKADAAIRVFETGGRGVRWAVVDSGVDARHPAFARLDKLETTDQIANYMVCPRISRVVKTLDFTRFASITSGRVTDTLARKLLGRMPRRDLVRHVKDIENALASGQMLDWVRIEPLLDIPHSDPYEFPPDTHGTHVAGIIGANWKSSTYKGLTGKWLEPPTELADSTDVCGVCPDIELLDLRVFAPRKDAQARAEEGSDEFAILAALQYVRYLNQSKDRQYIHGVNLSLSLRHEVRSYACGSTPVCLECERLVGSGVVVVAAAGNYGYDEDYGATHLGGAYRGQSITDPGNSPSVITVGSTHRTDPYQFGISYFSSHGPTGDGRNKPDLIAPGEKVISTIPGAGLASKDGTSMAAPHVSGIAALLLSRNTELMGQPQRVKEILCGSASDLGRDKVFQGHGLVDALRALQSV